MEQGSTNLFHVNLVLLSLFVLAVSCGPLPSPLNGEKIIETGTTLGDKIVFSCRIVGYELSGSRTRICQGDGQWSGSPARCSRKSDSQFSLLVGNRVF